MQSLMAIGWQAVAIDFLICEAGAAGHTFLALLGSIVSPLSLEVGDGECDAFCAAVEYFIACHQFSLSRT
jgi:hypothetical protein